MKRLKMRQNQTKGHLFTFCGLDGCGKTTMLAMLKADMEQEHNVFLTKQPTMLFVTLKYLETIWIISIIWHSLIGVYLFLRQATDCSTEAR